MDGPKKVGKIKLKTPSGIGTSARPALASGSGGTFRNGVKVTDFAKDGKEGSIDKGKGKQYQQSQVRSKQPSRGGSDLPDYT